MGTEQAPKELLLFYVRYAKLLVERERVRRTGPLAAPVEVKTWEPQIFYRVRRAKDGGPSKRLLAGTRRMFGDEAEAVQQRLREVALTEKEWREYEDARADQEPQGEPPWELLGTEDRPVSVGVWGILRGLCVFEPDSATERERELDAFCSQYPLGMEPGTVEMVRGEYLHVLEIAIDLTCDEVAGLSERVGEQLPWDGPGARRCPRTETEYEAVSRALRDLDARLRGKVGSDEIGSETVAFVLDNAQLPPARSHVEAAAPTAERSVPTELPDHIRAGSAVTGGGAGKAGEVRAVVVDDDELARAKREGNVLADSEKATASWRGMTVFERAITWLQAWQFRHDPQDTDISHQRIAGEIVCHVKTLSNTRMKGHGDFKTAHTLAEKVITGGGKPKTDTSQGFKDHMERDLWERPTLHGVSPGGGPADLGATPSHKYDVDEEDGRAAVDDEDDDRHEREANDEALSLLQDPPDEDDDE